MKTKTIFILSLGIFIIILLIVFVPSLLNPSPNKPVYSPLSFDKDYSSLNKTLPGRSTIADVEKINGKPDLTESKNGEVYLYYKTPSSALNNLVVFKNGVEIFAFENIFSNYRGAYEDLAKAYGQPDVTLYKNQSHFLWQVFLKDGVGVETDGENILAIIYFIPQDKNSFMRSVGTGMGFSEQKPEPAF